jgi:flagellin-like protein
MRPGGLLLDRAHPTAGGRWRRKGQGRRGVSEVIATILILALTVVLFSSIFFFIQSFPKPAPQSSDTFKASISLGPPTGGSCGGNLITGLSLGFYAGPTLTQNNAQIYVTSQSHPGAIVPPSGSYYRISDSSTSPLKGASLWQVGQTWTANLTSFSLKLCDNLTVTILSGSTLLFRSTIPGQSPFVPPVFVSFGTSPSSPVHGKNFSIVAVISDANTIRWVNVSMIGLPGFSSTHYCKNEGGSPDPGAGIACLIQNTSSVKNVPPPAAGSWCLQVNTSGGSNPWCYHTPGISGVIVGSTSGAVPGTTYYVVITATDSLFQRTQVVVPIVFK